MNKQKSLIRGVIRDIGFSSVISVVHTPGVKGIQTKAAGFILTKDGLRIQVK